MEQHSFLQRARVDEIKLRISIIKSEFERLNLQEIALEKDKKNLLIQANELWDQESRLLEQISDAETDMLIQLGL